MKARLPLQRLMLGMVVLAIQAGCSATNEIDYGSITLYSVSGTVTMDGEPLAGAVITFEDPETGNFSFARTSGSGSYTLQFDSQKDGVMPGRKVVRLSTTRNVLGIKGDAEVGEGEVPGESSTESPAPEKKKEQVPDCYNKDSKLTLEVTGSATFNFDLKSDCSTTGPAA